MGKSRFSVRFKQFFPQEIWSWVYLALKQDGLLWESLENTGLGEQALETFPANPAIWTPGNLAALAVLGSLPAGALNVEPLPHLEEKAFARAVQVGREWEHGSVADLDFKKAGLVALYCRELWRKDPSCNELLTRFSNVSQSSGSILGILYGLIPGPLVLFQVILTKSSKAFPVSEILHAVFSNPMPAQAQMDVLHNLLQQVDLGTGLQILRATQLNRPWISRPLSLRYLESINGNFPQIQLDETPEKQCEMIRDTLHLSELLAMSGKAGTAVNGLNRTISAARELQGKIAARYASTLSVTGSSAEKPVPIQQLQPVVVNAWRHATQLAPEVPGHQSGLVKALITAGLPEQAQEVINRLSDQPDQLAVPGILVASASLENHFGNTSRAFELAQQALSSMLSGNPFDLEEALDLVRLLNRFGYPELVVQAAQTALKRYPANGELLQLSAQSLLLKEKPGQAILNIYSIIAAGESSQVEADQPGSSEHLQRMVIDSLERMGEWEAAITERSNLMGRYATALPQDLHGLAKSALRAGQTDLANEACQKALEIDQNDAVAYQLLGETSLAVGDLPEAIRRFQKSVHLAPTLPAAWLTLSKTYRLSGEQGQMLQTLRSASLALPDSPEIQLALGEAYLEQDEPTQALPSLRKAAVLANSPHIALRLGQTLLKLGHLEESRKVLERALKIDGPGIHSQLVMLAEQTLSEQEAELNLLYATTLRAQGESARSIPVLEKVIQSFPEWTGPRLNLARSLIEVSADQASLDRAIELLQGILSTQVGEADNPTAELTLHNEARLLLAENLAKRGNFAESLTQYRQLLDASVSYKSNELGRLAAGFAGVALALNEPEQALALLKEASQNEPRNPSLLKLQSQAYLASGLVEESFEAARLVLDLTPADLENVIWFIEQAGSIQSKAAAKKLPVGVEVARALDYATQLAPTRADLLLRLGRALEESGDRFAAAEIYRRLASLDSQQYHVALKDLYSAALALRNIGDLEISIAILQRITGLLDSNLDPALQEGLCARSEIFTELAHSHQLAGNLPAALQSLDAAIEQEASVDLYLYRVDLLEQMGDGPAALESLETAFRHAPANTRILIRMANSLKNLGRQSEALNYAERAVQLATQLPGTEDLHAARLLAAELANSQLNVQKAWEYIHADLAGDQEVCKHPEHSFLRAEMALDAREADLAREELERLEEFSKGGSVFTEAHITADQVRLACLSNDYKQAGEKLVAAMRLLDADAPNKEVAVAGFVRSEQVASLRAVSQAALDLGKWDTAMNISRRLATLAQSEPITHLHMVQVIVRRAEAQLLCQDLEIRKNSAGFLSLGEDSRSEFSAAIESAASSLLNGEKLEKAAGNPLADKSLPRLIKLWYARGQAAFDPNPSNAFILGNVLRENASRPDELAALLALFRRLGENGSVIKAVENFEKKEPAGNYLTLHPLVQIQIALALEVAEPEQGISILQETLAGMAEDNLLDWPNAAMLNFLVARLAARARQWGAAQAAIQDALIAWPDEARWHALAAEIFLSEDPDGDLPDQAQAIDHLESCLRYEPDNENAYKMLGQIYLEREEYSRASPLLEKAVGLSPDDSQAWQVLARVQLKSGSIEAAAKSAENALKVDGSSVEAGLLRAEIALRSNNPRGAINRLQEILNTNPENAHALYLMALSLQALDRNEEALAAIDQALQLEQDPQDLLIEKIKLVRKLEGFDAGLRLLQEQIKEHPRDIQLVVMLSDWLFEAGNQQSAVQVAQAVLQSNHYRLTPRQISELHFRTGFQMRRAGQLDQALHHLSKSIEHYPGYIDAYLELGRAYQDQRAYPQALKVYQKAIIIAPTDYRPYYLAGQAMKEGKDFLNAEAMLRKAAQLAPDEVGVHRLLGAVVVLNLVHSRRIASDETKTT